MAVDPYLFKKGMLVAKEFHSGIAVREIVRLGQCPGKRSYQVETSCVFYKLISHPWLKNGIGDGTEFHCTITSMKNWGDSIGVAGEFNDFVKYEVDDYIRAIFFHLIEGRIPKSMVSFKTVKHALRHYFRLTPQKIGALQASYKRRGSEWLEETCPNTKETARWMYENLFINLFNKMVF